MNRHNIFFVVLLALFSTALMAHDLNTKLDAMAETQHSR
jgi:hypothetical protein